MKLRAAPHASASAVAAGVSPRPGIWHVCNCYANDPERIITWTSRHVDRLGPDAPAWFGEFGFDLGELCSPRIALRCLRLIEPVVASGVHEPARVVAAVRARPGSAAQAAAVVLAGFFTRTGRGAFNLYGPSGIRSAADIWPGCGPARPGAGLFTGHLLAQRQRAGLYGTRSLSEATIARPRRDTCPPRRAPHHQRHRRLGQRGPRRHRSAQQERFTRLGRPPGPHRRPLPEPRPSRT